MPENEQPIVSSLGAVMRGLPDPNLPAKNYATPTERTKIARTKGFTAAYKMSVFSLWYELGKPNYDTLFAAIKTDERGEIPAKATIQSWIKDDFLVQGEALDHQLQDAMAQRLIQEKIAMLDEHTKTAQHMQQIAMTYLDEHQDDLKVPNAVRLLVEGIRVERESRGIPAMLDKIADQSTEELLKNVQDLFSKATPNLEAITDEE